jgi:hypothetical protein
MNRKLSKKVIDLMIEGYTANAEEDLAIAKEFEKSDAEVNKLCDK